MSDEPAPGYAPPMVWNPEVYGPTVFTRNEADGALPNGTRVRKIDGDFDEKFGAPAGKGPHAATQLATPIGAEGVVIGSLFSVKPERGTPEWRALAPRFRDSKFFYFVEWRTSPQVASGAIDKKIEEVK